MKRKMYPDNMIVGDLGTYGMCEEIEQTHPNESDLQYAIAWLIRFIHGRIIRTQNNPINIFASISIAFWLRSRRSFFCTIFIHTLRYQMLRSVSLRLTAFAPTISINATTELNRLIADDREKSICPNPIRYT